MPRHTARAIVIKDGNLLLMERWRPGRHYFSVPGGGIEAGETAEQAVVREILEETGCIVTIERQLYILTIDSNDHYIYLCNFVSGDPHLPADSPEALLHDPDNRFEPCWLPLSELPHAPFLIWRPIQQQLLRDLRTGFAENIVEITSEPSR
jgi:8-oxo-dGTP diphosphatase